MKYIIIGIATIIFLIIIFGLAHTASECSREEEKRWAKEQEEQNKRKKSSNE